MTFPGRILFALSAAILFVGYHEASSHWFRLKATEGLWLCIVGSLLTTVAGTIFVSTFRRRHTAMLIEAAEQGAPLKKDGSRCALVGQARPAGEALVSPFHQDQCIAYQYWMYREPYPMSDTQHGSYFGYATQPFFVRTNSGEEVAVSEYPVIREFAQFKAADKVSYSNADAYLKATQFQELRDAYGFVKEFRKAFGASPRLVRQDWRKPKPPMPLDFVECYLPVGQEICVLGRFSPKTNSFVPEQPARKNPTPKIFVAAPLVEFPSMINYAVALILALVVNLVVFGVFGFWWYANHGSLRKLHPVSCISASL